MKIEPNWTITSEGPWQLIYDDKSIIILSEASGTTSTSANVFVGTKEECEEEMKQLGLPMAGEDPQQN